MNQHDRRQFTQSYSLTVNGRTQSIDTAPIQRLSDVLRNQLQLTGTKVGCDAGDCGACSVIIDGKIACSCLVAVAQADGCEIETVESFCADGILNNLQQSFLRHGAAQCGICTPGMLTSAMALLKQKPEPKRQEVEDALGGVLCRCTGYKKIVDAVMEANATAQNAAIPQVGEQIGHRLQHLDGVQKTDGSLAYGADGMPDNALYLRVIRSPYHAADFTIGDKRAFIEKHNGIDLFLDASDVPGRNCFGVIPPFADQPVFAEKQALYRGDAVAALVGELSVIEAIDFDELPIEWTAREAVLLPDDATEKGAPQVHEDKQGNILVRGYVGRGDPENGLAQAAHKVHVTTSTPFIEHAYIEPEAGYCVRVGDRLELHGCTQSAYMDRESLAEIMGLEQDAIRIRPSACGGGFGSKIDLSFQPFIAIAAWKSDRPVAICYSRTESIISTTKRHPSRIKLTVGCDEQGKICGFDFEGIFNTGAYASWGPTVANRVPVHASGPYLISDYSAKSVAVHTHTAPSGAFRGFGVPQSAVAQETAFDQLADLAGIDRLEFRLRNALQNGQPTATGQIFEQGVGIEECLRAIKPTWIKANETARKFNAQSGNSKLRKGVGIGTCWYGCGNTSLPNPSTIRMGIKRDGTVILHQGAMDIGQGSNTVISQIAADALGIEVHSLKMIDGDTDLTPDCGKTSASRQTYITGKAAELAGKALRTNLLRHGNVGSDAEIIFDDGQIILKDRGIESAVDLTGLTPNEFGYVLMSEETYDPPVTALDENGQGNPYAVYGYGAQLMELTVDTGLGTVKLDRITTAHDVGKAINPMLVEGQIEGGVAQGIGLALMEEFIPGRTENLHDYLIPTFGDMPQFENIIIEVADAEGPYGAKGLGEHVLIPTAPAILNAIRDATGAVVSDLPATPDKVLAAINRVKQRGSA